VKERQRKIGVITFPVSEAGLVPLQNLIDILHPLSEELYLVTGGAGYSFFAESEKVHAHRVEHKAKKDIPARITNYIWTQLKISWRLAKLTRNVNLWIFFIGGEGLMLPLVVAKLLRRKVVIASAGSGPEVACAQRDPLAIVATLLQNITYRLSDRIIMYSERLVEEYGLRKYGHKISIVHRHFLDFDTFNLNVPLRNRRNVIGYIGRLSQEKGVMNFIKTIPDLLKERDDLEFLICGDGQLRDEIEKYISEKNLNDKVKLVGWIPHEGLPDYFKKLKLVVLPSYTEGLPNVVLEAMACGTPVLATLVGAVPDVIMDGKTGFIMEDNSPACIAENVIRALEHPELEMIVENARALVEREFTYEAAVERYRKILEEF